MKKIVASVMLALALVFSSATAASAQTFGNSVSVSRSSAMSGAYVDVWNVQGKSIRVYAGGNSRSFTGFYHVQSFRVPALCTGYSQWGHPYIGGFKYSFKDNWNGLILRVECKQPLSLA